VNLISNFIRCERNDDPHFGWRSFGRARNGIVSWKNPLRILEKSDKAGLAGREQMSLCE